MTTILRFMTAATLVFAASPALSQSEPETAATEPAAETAPPLNEDEMANLLNAQQTVKQSVTLKRTINGAVVETKTETLSYRPGDPLRDTEAGQSAIERVKARFDSQVLTRAEAVDEARLDFVVADQNRDGVMTVEEFSSLVLNWRDMEARKAEAPTDELKRQQRYMEFMEEIDPQTADLELISDARKKFTFMAGVSGNLSRKDYIREVMLDFDSMDVDSDGLLRAEELLGFRAVNRGHEPSF